MCRDRLMIGFVHTTDEPTWHGYVYAVLLVVVSFIVLHQYFYRGLMVGMRIRKVLVAAVYNKVTNDFFSR